MRITRSPKIKSRITVSTPRAKRPIRQAKPVLDPLRDLSSDQLQMELLQRSIQRTCEALDRAHATTTALQAKHERQCKERRLIQLRIIRHLVLGKEAA